MKSKKVNAAIENMRGYGADKTGVILPIQISAWFGSRQVVAETALQEVSSLLLLPLSMLQLKSSINTITVCNLTPFK